MTSPIHYATYFDRHFVTRGVTMYRSLARHSPPFVLWILCHDDEVRQILGRLRLEHARLVSIEELEKAEPALLSVKADRLPLEYYWTCGPAFLCYLFQRHPDIESLSYVDSDMFFFASPLPLYEELGENSVLLIEHRATPVPNDERRPSVFNVGLLVFRQTARGLACLNSWREQCLEWCFDLYEEGRFGDQQYLDAWPARFEGVCVTRHEGAGLGPWNVATVQLALHEGRVVVGNDPMISYHFSKVRRINRFMYELHDWRFNRERLDGIVRRHIYRPYVRELFRTEREIRAVWGHVPSGEQDRRPETAVKRRRLSKANRRSVFHTIRRFMFVTGSFEI